MADEAPAGGTPPAPAPAADAAATGSTTAPTSSDEAWRNPKEIQKYFQRTQRLEDELKATQAQLAAAVAGRTTEPPQKTDKSSAPDAALAAVAELRLERDLERAFSALKIPDDSPQREAIEAAVKAVKPTDVRDFVRKFIPTPPATTAAPASAPPAIPPPAGKSDMGPPGANPQLAMPEDPRLLSAKALASMSPLEVKAHYEKWRRSQGGVNENQWRRMREERGAK